MGKLIISDHPLIQHKMAMLRNEETGPKEFRELVNEVAMLLCYEASRDLPLTDVKIKTPLDIANCKMITEKQICIASILRAGIAMTEGLLHLMPTAKVGHIGIYRDPETLLPVEYYCKFPLDINRRDVFLVDPMLATGGTAAAAAGFIKDRGVANIKLVCLIASVQGVAVVHEQHPDIDIYTAACDAKLDEAGYIVPGLGDAGDRIFGTK